MIIPSPPYLQSISSIIMILVAISVYYYKNYDNPALYAPPEVTCVSVDYPPVGQPNWIRSWITSTPLDNNNLSDAAKNAAAEFPMLHEMVSTAKVVKKGAYAGIYIWPELQLVLRVGLTADETTSLLSKNFIEDHIRYSLHLQGLEQSVLIKRKHSFTLPESAIATVPHYYHMSFLELATGGDFEEFLKIRRQERQCMQPRDSVRIILLISKLVKSLHVNGFIHCDLRLSNVLVRSRDYCTPDLTLVDIVLSDLSLSREFVPSSNVVSSVYPKSSHAVPEYAPEGKASMRNCFDETQECYVGYPWPGLGAALDIYSLGVTLETLVMQEYYSDEAWKDRVLSVARRMSHENVTEREAAFTQVESLLMTSS